MNILIYSNIEESKNVKAKEITIDRKNSSIVYFLFFFFLPSRNFITSNLIMNRSHYHLTRWIHLCQPWILNRRIVHIVRLNCEKCFSYGNPQLYHAIPTTEKHVPLMFIHALLSSTPPIVGGLRGLTMYRTRVTYTSWEYVSWGMLLHRIVVQTLPQLLNSSRQRLIKGTCLDDDTFSFAIKKIK